MASGGGNEPLQQQYITCHPTCALLLRLLVEQFLGLLLAQ
jgi:hypothetical protein